MITNSVDNRVKKTEILKNNGLLDAPTRKPSKPTNGKRNKNCENNNAAQFSAIVLYSPLNATAADKNIVDQMLVVTIKRHAEFSGKIRLTRTMFKTSLNEANMHSKEPIRVNAP